MSTTVQPFRVASSSAYFTDALRKTPERLSGTGAGIDL
jgi:hypothetical protein